MNNGYTTIERVLGKIDNDFNPDTSDWIPRCAAWCIDAMQQLKVLATEVRRRNLKVENRLAYLCCEVNKNSIKVYDINGCEIPELGRNQSCCSPSTGGSIPVQMTDPDTVGRITNITNPIINISTAMNRGYVLTCNGVIQLNFDADTIQVETLEVKTEWSDTYQTELPLIPNNGLLLEYLVWYCMFKLLVRGSRHQVLNLTSQIPTNPYLQMKELEPKVKASIIIENQRQDDLYKGWANFFYNGSFLPRN